MTLGTGWRCCFVLVWLWLAANQARAEVLALNHAQVTVILDDQRTDASVQLPYQWDSRHRGLGGEADFQIPFSLAMAPTEPYSLYVPRLGNRYAIWLNGRLLEQHGDIGQRNGPDFAKAPRLVVLTPGLLSQHNLIRIQIQADVGRRGGLAPLVLGPHEEVYPLYLQDHRSRITGSFLVAVFGLLVGVVALALWATQVRPGGRRDPLYLYAAVAELCWTVSVSDALLESPPVPWPWWGLLPIITTSLWTCSMTLFGVEIAGLSQSRAATWLRRWLLVLMLLVLAAALGRALVFPDALPWAYGLSGLSALIFAGVFVWRAVRGGAPQHRLVAAAVVANTIVGLRDIYVFQILQAYGENTYLRYSSLLFGLSLAYIVIQRFRAASWQVLALNTSLAQQVAQKEIELATSYQRLAQGVQEQARSGERSRILRDMHDGVGSHISTAIRQLQSGRASGDEVLQTLRDSLDQLKLSIDAIHLPPGDVTALLANLRYRLEPRLRACGIELDWAVEALAPVAALDAGAMRQLQFMLFEAISNVMQHARASQLRIEAQQVGPGVQVRVVDNGCGFDTSQVPRRGLRLMQERAQTIGAQLHIDSQPGHTALELRIG
jgi:signal transduction histidine kinase